MRWECCCADSWAGMDKIVPFRLRVSDTTRAEREGRTAKTKGQAFGDEAAAEDREGDEDEDEEDDEEEGVHQLLLLHAQVTECVRYLHRWSDASRTGVAYSHKGPTLP